MKLIATDLDGTLLDEKGEVSVENAQAIRNAMAQGIEVVVATGRAYDSANNQIQAAGLSLPIISLNGAKAFTKDKEMIRSVPMDKDICKRVNSICQAEDVYFEIFTNKGAFSSSRENFSALMVDVILTSNPDVPKEEIQRRVERRFEDENVHFTSNYDEIIADETIKIYKFLAFSMDDTKLTKIAQQLEKETDLAITSSGNTNLEVNHKNAQKGYAVKEYAKSKGIDMKDVMTLGDNYNDESMLRMAGRGVAMGNAEEAIKNFCDYTTKTNDEHGVAFAIEEMLRELAVTY